MFNPVVADLPPSTPLLFPFSPSLRFPPSFFRFSVPFGPRLLPPSVSSPSRRSEAAGPPDAVVHHSYQAGSFPRHECRTQVHALVVALVFLVLLAVTFEEGVCCKS